MASKRKPPKAPPPAFADYWKDVGYGVLLALFGAFLWFGLLIVLAIWLPDFGDGQ